MDLNELSKTTSLEDAGFSPTPKETYIPEAGARNRAAYLSLLDGDANRLSDTYYALLEESSRGEDAYHQQILGKIRQEDQQALQTEAMKVIADPSVPNETKKKLVEDVKNPTSPIYDVKSKVAANAIQNINIPNNRTETAWINTVENINKLREEQEKYQAVVNSLNANIARRTEQGNKEMEESGISPNDKLVSDFVTFAIVPFSYQSYIAGTVPEAEAKTRGQEEASFFDQLYYWMLPGSAQKEMQASLKTMTPDQQIAFAKNIAQEIKDRPGVIPGNENQFAQLQLASLLDLQGGYSSFEAFIDNTAAILDIVGLGSMFRSAVRGEKVVKAVDKATETRAIGNQIVNKTNPVSIAKTSESVNPEAGRQLTLDLVMSEGDEFAEASAVASKDDALVSINTPQAGGGDKVVLTKTPDPEKIVRQEVEDLPYGQGGLEVTEGEKQAVKADVINKFRDAEGLELNPAMSSFEIEGGRIDVKAVLRSTYGNIDGGLPTAQEAYDYAKYALKDLVDEGAITILKQDGVNHIPVNLADEVGEQGNYLVQVESKMDIGVNNILNYEKQTPRFTWFDRIPGLTWGNKGWMQGSVSRMIWGASSMIDPKMFGASSNAADYAARISKVLGEDAKSFTKKFGNIDKTRHDKVWEFIRRANKREIPYTEKNLVAEGFQPNEIDALNDWRSFWDGVWHLENLDAARTLRAQGYKKIMSSNFEGFAKEIDMNLNIKRAYDPSIDEVVDLSADQIRKLYEDGGTMSELRRTLPFDDEYVDYVMVRDIPDEYLRVVADSDSVLPYKHGYYQTQYKRNALFVDEILEVDAKGVPTKYRTIAVAGDHLDAENFKLAKEAETGRAYRVRKDSRGLRQGSDEYHDLNSANGRIAHRRRGEQLEAADGVNHLGVENRYVVDPVDAATFAANSIASRTAKRNMLEVFRKRWLEMYPQYASKDRVTGFRSLPDSPSAINGISKEAGQARAMLEYVQFIENGYYNAIDDTYKAFMNILADTFGKFSVKTQSKGLAKAERSLVAAGEFAPLGASRFTAFLAYIIGNPLRQAILQPFQLANMMAYNLRGWASGRIPNMIVDSVAFRSGLKKSLSDEGMAAYKFLDEAGALEAIDQSALIRNTMEHLSSSSYKPLRIAGKVINIPKKVGFEMGEQLNLIGHYLSVYDRKIKEGVDLTDKVRRAEAYAEARALSWHMNKAGDMPYNSGALGLIMQFMAVPHKAGLMFLDRSISTADKFKIAIANLLMFGTPAVVVDSLFDIGAISDPKIAKKIDQGGMALFLNSILSNLAHESVELDYDVLSPYEWGGFVELFKRGFGDDAGKGGLYTMLGTSPFGQLVREGGRANDFFVKTSKLFGLGDPLENATPVDAYEVLRSAARVFSGANNYMKAQLLLETHKLVDTKGNVLSKEFKTDRGALIAAIAQTLGIPLRSQAEYYEQIRKTVKAKKDMKKEVTEVIDMAMKHATDTLQVENSNVDNILAVTAIARRAFKDNPAALREANRQLRFKVGARDSKLLNIFLGRLTGLDTPASFLVDVEKADLPAEQKVKLKQAYKLMIEAQQKIKEEMND